MNIDTDRLVYNNKIISIPLIGGNYNPTYEENSMFPGAQHAENHKSEITNQKSLTLLV